MFLKKFALIALPTVATFALLVAGCSKKNDSSTSSTGISATVSGKSISAPASATAGVIYAGSYWEVIGAGISGKDTVLLDITGEQNIVVNKATDSRNGDPVFVRFVSSSTGTWDGDATINMGYAAITVTTYDTVNHKIAGTFSGNCFSTGGTGDSVIVTNGKFNTTYTVQ